MNDQSRQANLFHNDRESFFAIRYSRSLYPIGLCSVQPAETSHACSHLGKSPKASLCGKKERSLKRKFWTFGCQNASQKKHSFICPFICSSLKCSFKPNHTSDPFTVKSYPQSSRDFFLSVFHRGHSIDTWSRIRPAHPLESLLSFSQPSSCINANTLCGINISLLWVQDRALRSLD